MENQDKPRWTDAELREKIEQILEQTLYGYNEGCIGNSCMISVQGNENAVKKLVELIKEIKL